MNRLAATFGAAAIAIAAPASAQDHSMHEMSMPGMSMPMPAKKPAAKRPTVRRSPAPPKSPPGRPARATGAAAAPPPQPMPAMPSMDHASMPGMEMGEPAAKPGGSMQAIPGMDISGGHDVPGMPGVAQTGTALPPGNAPAPAPPSDHYADRFFPQYEMARARSDMMHEDGGRSFHQVMFNLAELQVHDGKAGYRWDGEAWFGGDINRLWLKSEGEGSFRQGVDSAEVQALYSRAVSPFFNLQAGVRQDLAPSPNRTYATVGFEGLAPHMFEVEGALFLSDRGDLLGRLEGYYDQRITQRLVLQPRVELNLAAQDVPENRLGAGLTDAELGLRLRYETSRGFAPYIGVSYEAKTGRTADFARADGKDAAGASLVAGVRFWF